MSANRSTRAQVPLQLADSWGDSRAGQQRRAAPLSGDNAIGADDAIAAEVLTASEQQALRERDARPPAPRPTVLPKPSAVLRDFEWPALSWADIDPDGEIRRSMREALPK